MPAESCLCPLLLFVFFAFFVFVSAFKVDVTANALLAGVDADYWRNLMPTRMQFIENKGLKAFAAAVVVVAPLSQAVNVEKQSAQQKRKILIYNKKCHKNFVINGNACNAGATKAFQVFQRPRPSPCMPQMPNASPLWTLEPSPLAAVRALIQPLWSTFRPANRR